MCIINEPAQVTNTEILVTPNHNNQRQLVVYANKVQTQSLNNAMILPVPHPQTIKLHDLSQYSDIFKDCAKCFSSGMMWKLNFTNFSESLDNEILEVHDCGSYNVSIVPSHRDFHRLNSNYFQLNSLVGNILKKYYPTNFGFLVCKLKTGSLEKYHPIAYSHQIYQKQKMFVPTRHHHANHEESVSHYDHDIYSVNTKSLCGNEKWNYTFRIKTGQIPNFQFPQVVCFNKLKIKRNDKNTDLYFYLDSYPDPMSQYHGVDGCIYKTNHPKVTFRNNGSVYTQPLYRGLPFRCQGQELSFAGSGTTFMVNKNGTKVIVTDDIDTPEQHEMIFNFNTCWNQSNCTPGVDLEGEKLENHRLHSHLFDER